MGCRGDPVRSIRRQSRTGIAELNGQNHILSLAFDRWRINDLKREPDAIGCHPLRLTAKALAAWEWALAGSRSVLWRKLARYSR
jgi:hypothetical protein